MHLHKVIPSGAGLGGGSADAAFTIKLLNEKLSLELSFDQMVRYALMLGSDCPFFIINKPCFATSRGEIMEQVNIDLSNYKIVIVNPGVHISTAEAFAGIIPKTPSLSLKQIIQKPLSSWKKELNNDFIVSSGIYNLLINSSTVEPKSIFVKGVSSPLTVYLMGKPYNQTNKAPQPDKA